MNLEESNSRDWEVMARYIAGEMDDDERKNFQEKLDFSEYDKNLVQELKSDWEIMENYNKNKDFDADKAWNNLHSKFQQDGLLEDIQSTQNMPNYRFLLRIAAILLVGILFATLAYYLVSHDEKTNWKVADTYQKNNNSKIILADGSVVYLNANSKLYYPEKFDGKERIVEFEGDAFFEITKNPQRPFIIKAKDAEIKVLGTSFNVNTNTLTKDVEVLVETGKVKLSSIENKKFVLLDPGYMGDIQKQQPSMHKNTDKNYLSWKTKYFDFNEGIKLGVAVEILNRAYHCNIRCENDEVFNKQLYTTFEQCPLDKILQLISESFGLKGEKLNGEIILSIK